MDDYEIRDLPKERLGELRPLWEALNALHLEDSVYFKDYFRRVTFGERMEPVFGTPEEDLKTTVVVSGDTILGYCFSVVKDGNGELESLYLDPSLRGRKIGFELVRRHVAWMKQRKCRRIRVGVSHGHESVLGFYEKAGFRPRVIVLEYIDQ